MRYHDNILNIARFLMNLTLDIDKFYVSPFDKMMREFDATHTCSVSQSKEIEKHAQIAKLRDEAIVDDEKEKIWSGF